MQISEKTIETKTCKHCNTTFEITDKDLDFYEKISPIFWWKKYLIPSPTLCPDCRQQRRLSFRNQNKLYKRQSSLSQKNILSIYSPDKPFQVYEQSEWLSETWSPLDYQTDVFIEKSFVEQFHQLYSQVPKMALFNMNSENCDYCHSLIDSKNCYLSFWNTAIEDVLYSYESWSSSDSLDLLWCYDVHHSYQSIDSSSLQDCYYCNNCSFLTQSSFCNDCTNLKHCLFCFWIHHREYCIFNEQYSPEEFQKKHQEWLEIPNLIEYSLKVSKEFFQTQIHQYSHWSNNENCTGDYIFDSKNVESWFSIVSIQDSKYIYDSGRTNDLMDGSYIYDSDWMMFESINIYNSSQILFSININSSHNLQYCDNMFQCSHCFWCVWLAYQSYCILNKPYTKEEYELLVPKIIQQMQKDGKWGEFFPSSLSPFGYNETDAMGYFPIPPPIPNPIPPREKDAWKADRGSMFNWSRYEAPFPKVEKVIPARLLPDDISKIPDDILNWAIECEVTKKPFRIVAQELAFYRKHTLPIPRRHPDQRHLDRMALRNPRKLFERKCGHCGKALQTTYSPDRPEIVYCEECYTKEVFS